jgi:lysophospholipase L1-like esterase
MSDRRNFLEKSLLFLGGYGLLPGFFIKTSTGNLSNRKAYIIKSEEEELLKIRNLMKGKAPIKWVFAGDSITQGAKHTFGYRSYPEIFAERVRWELGRVRDFVINTAISGNTSKDILNDFDWRIGQFSPNIVSLMVGTNDASEKKEISPATFRENNINLINKIRQLGAIPILQTPNIIVIEKAIGRERINEYITVTREVAAEKKVVLVDHFNHWKEKLSATPNEEIVKKWLNDELHPNSAGHIQMAQLLFRKLSIFDPNSFTCRES